MIYTNGKCIIGDSVDELAVFAVEMGINKKHIQNVLFPDNGNAYQSIFFKIWGNARKLILRDDRVHYIVDPKDFRRIIILLYN